MLSLKIGQNSFTGTEQDLTTVLEALLPPFPDSLELKNASPDFLNKFQMMFNFKIAQEKTITRFGRIWREHAITNLPKLAKMPSISRLFGKFENVPSITVAPGPSLDKNIVELRRVQGRALIVCFMQSLRPLLVKGILPDLVLCADAGDFPKHYEGLDLSGVGAFVGTTNLVPAVWDLPFKHKFFFLGCDFDRWMLPELEGVPILTSGGSISTVALVMNHVLRTSPRILVGHDHAFPSDGDIHCKDAAQYNKREEFGSLVMLPGYYGGQVTSHLYYSMYRDWLGRAIAKMTEEGAFIINSTEGGAKIDNALQMPLSQAITRHATVEVPVRKILEEADVPEDRSLAVRALLKRVPSVETPSRDETSRSPALVAL